MALIDDLEHALDATELLLTDVPEGEWSQSTPCPEWSLEQLVQHLSGGNRLFAAALRHEPPTRLEPVPTDELLASYRASVTELVAATESPGALDGVVTVPIGTVPAMVAVNLRIVEALVHGWDIARTRQIPISFDDEVVARSMQFTESALSMLPADRRPFDPPQPAADDAPILDRFAAMLGRRA